MRVLLVRGVGDVGSAVAYRLFVAGFGVVLHDIPQPTTTRRGMAFADAVFDGHARLAGIDAVLVNDLAAVSGIIALRAVIPVVVADLDAVLRAVLPDVAVDARMRKRAAPGTDSPSSRFREFSPQAMRLKGGSDRPSCGLADAPLTNHRSPNGQ